MNRTNNNTVCHIFSSVPVLLKEIAMSISCGELYLSFYHIKRNVESFNNFTDKIPKIGHGQLA